MQITFVFFCSTYVSPVGVRDLSLVSTLRIDTPPGTGSSVSRRRTPEPGKRTVCARNLSFVVFVRFVMLTLMILVEHHWH